MNYVPRSVASDSGSLDEYGDINHGNFNEDGSFIGQYGRSNGYNTHTHADIWQSN